MLQVNCFKELFSLARVNRAAYQAFKAHELLLIKTVLWKVSPPAWELRQISEVMPRSSQQDPGSQSLAASLYLRHYARDLYILVRIKFLIRTYCRAILSNKTVTALDNPGSDEDTAIDDTIWRVWTFCYLFGSQKGREWDLAGQVQWLRGETFGSDLPLVCCTSPDPSDIQMVSFIPPEGFAYGNRGPLLETQVQDMVEIWTAMHALLDFLRVDTLHARQHSVFDGFDIALRDIQREQSILNMWLEYILTLGPAAVLELVPDGTSSDPGTAFAQAASYG
ncbi:hypothetical protein BDV23DRAFT_177251 [Aspergillus alliaceus]|uniref:Uncharacterized protein n=1 Tax=Petromyces alliaceus TaxID=209559 RepID=A0A5N7BQS3_PETAA|nr:hypothetical protein BDV23DRAFT_177251 [Aspergillus alliaceus]